MVSGEPSRRSNRRSARRKYSICVSICTGPLWASKSRARRSKRSRRIARAVSAVEKTCADLATSAIVRCSMENLLTGSATLDVRGSARGTRPRSGRNRSLIPASSALVPVKTRRRNHAPDEEMRTMESRSTRPAILIRRAATMLGEGRALEHDPEKWVPVFGKRSCSKKKLERDDDSKKSHHALRSQREARATRQSDHAIFGAGLGRIGNAEPGAEQAT